MWLLSDDSLKEPKVRGHVPSNTPHPFLWIPFPAACAHDSLQRLLQFAYANGDHGVGSCLNWHFFDKDFDRGVSIQALVVLAMPHTNQIVTVLASQLLGPRLSWRQFLDYAKRVGSSRHSRSSTRNFDCSLCLIGDA
jgi:hypothetical protein